MFFRGRLLAQKSMRYCVFAREFLSKVDEKQKIKLQQPNGKLYTVRVLSAYILGVPLLQASMGFHASCGWYVW